MEDSDYNNLLSRLTVESRTAKSYSTCPRTILVATTFSFTYSNGFITLAMNYSSFLNRNIVFLYSARKINFVIILSQDLRSTYQVQSP